MMPGPSWYALAVFVATLQLPAGEMTAATPLPWGSETPVTTGQVGGGPGSSRGTPQNLGGRCGLRQVGHDGLQSAPTSPDSRPGYPAYPPLAKTWLASLATNPYFAADPTPALKAAAG